MSERADVHATPRGGWQPCGACDAHADARTTDVLLCAGCLARFHVGCWSGACGACGGAEALGPVRAAPDASAVRIVSLRRPRARVRVGRVALVLGLIVVSALALARTAPPAPVAVDDVSLIDAWSINDVDGPVVWIPDEPVDVVEHPPALLDDEVGGALTRDALTDSIRRSGMWAAVDEARAKLRRGDRQGSLADYDRALSLWTEEPAPWVERARVRNKLRDHEGALADAERALALALDRVDARFQRAFALGELRRFDEGQAEWTRVLERAPRDAWAWNNRGFDRAHGGDPAGAIADCTRALELRPGMAYAHNNRAWALLLLGDLDGAAADVERSLELDARNPWALETRARVRLARGERALALDDVGRCLELAPDYPRVAEARALEAELVGLANRR